MFSLTCTVEADVRTMAAGVDGGGGLETLRRSWTKDVAES